MNGYELSRKWFDFSFENPHIINPGHCAIYFFAIEHCNRLGWKDKFGFPSQMVMEAVGIKNWKTYSKYLQDLVDWGFLEMIEKSKNQYSSNIITIKNATVKNTKALDKALSKHSTKHSTKHSQSTVSIDKQENKGTKEQKNILQEYKKYIEENNTVTSIVLDTFIKLGYKPNESIEDFKKWIKTRIIDIYKISSLVQFENIMNNFFDYWIEKKNTKNKNWKSTFTNYFELKNLPLKI